MSQRLFRFGVNVHPEWSDTTNSESSIQNFSMFLCVKKPVVRLSHVLMDVRLDHQWSPETCCCCELTDCDWITEDVNSLSVA